MSDTLLATDIKVELFHACYDIGGDKPGAPLFSVNVVVSTPSETVQGVGHITQATNPPLDIATKLDGSYTSMTVMPDTTHILVTLVGYPLVNWPSHGGIGPALLPNTDLRMVLQDDWKSGTATFRYVDASGAWQTITDAPVRACTCATL